MDAETLHRFQFAFTITYHYLFPQLSMGLALLVFIFKTQALKGDELANVCARFWAKVLGLAFVMGVVTGIPMEFQFGTNWSRFSHASGGIIGQTLAMEGVFAFFLESSFLYLLVFQEKKLGHKMHWFSALMVWIGTWLSGYFIVCTNAWMQHPVGYSLDENGAIYLTNLIAILTNPWAIRQYAHVMVGTTITASFVIASIGAFYLLQEASQTHSRPLGQKEHEECARKFLRLGVIVGTLVSILAVFPTGDLRAKILYKKQPVTFAAMEGIFKTHEGVGLIMIGQPNVEEQKLDNPFILPKMLSFLTHARWDASIQGLDSFDPSTWPDNIPLLYYTYRIMAGLGTFFILIMCTSAFYLWKNKLYESRWLMWILMLSFPFPFIANIAGWITTETGRQPWLIYGLMRTADGYSANVSAGNTLFTLIGFMGLYTVISLLYFFLMTRIVREGTVPEHQK